MEEVCACPIHIYTTLKNQSLKARNEIESTIDADFKSLQTQKLRILIKKKNHLQEMRKAYSPENYES